MINVFDRNYYDPFGDGILFSLIVHMDSIKGQSCFTVEEKKQLNDIRYMLHDLEARRREGR